MKKNQCKEALEIYKTFLNRMTKLSEFLKVAEVTSVCPTGPPPSPRRRRRRAHTTGGGGGGGGNIRLEQNSTAISALLSSPLYVNLPLSPRGRKFHFNLLRFAPDTCDPWDLIYSPYFTTSK